MVGRGVVVEHAQNVHYDGFFKLEVTVCASLPRMLSSG